MINADYVLNKLYRIGDTWIKGKMKKSSGIIEVDEVNLTGQAERGSREL